MGPLGTRLVGGAVACGRPTGFERGRIALRLIITGTCMVKQGIRVDLWNPGQVFACLGLLEAADALLGEAEGAFDWSDEAAISFILRADGNRNPIQVVLEFLAEAKVSSVAPFN